MTSLFSSRSLLYLLLSLTAFRSQSAVAAPEPEAKSLRGTVVLWSRPSCAPGEMCELPQRLGIEWPVELPLATGPFAKGTRTVLARKLLKQKNWSVDIALYRVDPADGSPSYVITQTRLIEALLGVIAECSRYDGVDELRILPPGSCSSGGRGFKTYGVSLISER